MSNKLINRPRRIRLFRFFGRPTFRNLYRILSKPKVEGIENVPKEGPYLITSNHLAFTDPPLLLAFWPIPVEALGAANMMRRHIFGWIMRSYGAYAVQRDSFDRSVVRIALTILQNGRPLFIAPEGSRSPTGMKPAQPGAAYLAVKASVPIVPVGMIGTEQMIAALRRGYRAPITMRIGKPYQLPDIPPHGKERHKILENHTNEIMGRIAALLPSEYHGVYAAHI